MKKTLFNLIALALLAAPAAAFELDGVSAADIRATQTDFRGPVPAAPAADDLIGMDLRVRVPFSTVKKGVELVAKSEKRLTILDQAAPVMFKSGEFLKISNIQVDQGGIVVLPTLTLKPYLEGRDKLAIRVQRIALHASMEPSVKSAPAPAVDQEQIMTQVMDVLIKGTYSAVNEFLRKKQIPMKAEDVIRLRYDKAAWTLHGQISPKILGQFVPAGLFAEPHLTGFSFNDKGLVITVQTPE